MGSKAPGLLLAAAIIATWSGDALADCESYISDFRKTLNTDVKSGKIDQSRHDQISSEVDRIDNLCRQGDQGRALKVLLTTQERYGYRQP